MLSASLAFRFFVVLTLVLLNVSQVSAQKKYALVLIASDPEVLKKYRFEQLHTDSLAAATHLRQVLLQLHEQAYLLASVDSLSAGCDSLTAYLHIGKPFRWASLQAGNVDERTLSSIGYREKIYQNRPFSFRQLADLEEKLLQYADNQGYPFATVRMDSVTLHAHAISASLYYEPGPLITFDTLSTVGTAKLKRKFLAAYVGIVPGQAFSQAKLIKAEKLLRQLGAVQTMQPASVTFRNDRAYPVFYADNRKANQFDGIIGFLPNEQQKNKLLITGEVNLQLRNLFSSGKNFLLKWQQIRQASPRLDISYGHPALFGTPLSLNVDFGLLKEDSTFLTINRRATLGYFLKNGAVVSLSASLRTSQLGNNAQYREAVSLPDYSDVNWLAYGIGYQWQNVNDDFYPATGTIINVQAQAGNKKIEKNPFVEPELYENVTGQSAQFSVRGSIRWYFPISPRAVLVTQTGGGKLINDHLFLNDLFRIGGLNSLRGFNENFFYASDYGLATLEYRYRLDAQSYFFLFYDQAYLQYKLSGKYAEDAPAGLGAGVSFTTNAGIFNLIYAIGRTNGQPFSLGASKIHFGLTSRF